MSREEQKNKQKDPKSSQEVKETQTNEEKDSLTTKASAWKQIMQKKWFFPAVYLAAAALILAFITWYQSPNDYAIDGEDATGGVDVEHGDNDFDEEAMPVTAQEENMISPVSEDEGIEIVLGFFDEDASEEEQLEAMVEYNNSFYPHLGINYAHPEGESFDVMAALSGTVVTAEKDALVGYYIEIEHDNGLKTVYQSLEGLELNAGDQVAKGDVIGRAGRNVYEQSMGIHLHFEVRENGVPVNPEKFLSGEMSQAEESETEEAEDAESDTEETESDDATDTEEDEAETDSEE